MFVFSPASALNAAKAQLAAAQLAYDALQKGGSNVYASLKGDAVWDQEENTLVLRIPDKGALTAQD